MSHGLFGKEYTLDDIAEHRVWYFFSDRRLTDRDINVLLALGSLLTAMAAVGLIGWGWAVPGVLALALLWRNWRRFNQRLFHALADRDRDGVDLPIHPDRR